MRSAIANAGIMTIKVQDEKEKLEAAEHANLFRQHSRLEDLTLANELGFVCREKLAPSRGKNLGLSVEKEESIVERFLLCRVLPFQNWGKGIVMWWALSASDWLRPGAAISRRQTCSVQNVEIDLPCMIPDLATI